MRKVLFVLYLVSLCFSSCNQDIPHPHALSPLMVPVQLPSPLDKPAPNPLVYLPNGNLYLPVIQARTNWGCGITAEGAKLVILFLTDPGQQRVNPYCDIRLARLAQFRAEDMIARKYIGHINPDGWAPNHWLALYGCAPPDYYPVNGNTIESLALNYPTPEATWAALKASEGHRMHVLGELGTFRDQRAFGVGYAESEWGEVTVVVSSICEE